jgi:hypothetical protein
VLALPVAFALLLAAAFGSEALVAPVAPADAVGAALFWPLMSAEVLPLALFDADVLLCGALLPVEALADCMSLVELAAPVFAACGGFELGLVVLGEDELGLFGLLVSVLPEELLGLALELPLLSGVLELPIEPLEVPVPVAPVPLAAPMPLEEELPAAQWSEICRTSETWNVLPVLLVALELPVLDVLVVLELAALPVPLICTCCPTYC